jgi:crossover junction endodeoxyribonuclease RusA
MTQPELFDPVKPKRKISFTVIGVPQPQGSSRAFVPRGWNRAIITSDNSKLKPWRQEIAGTAQAIMNSSKIGLLEDVPLSIEASFFFDKPKSAKKSLRYKITKPDVDKLVRGLFDALTGIVFRDDAQIVTSISHKRFGVPSRVEVSISEVSFGYPECERYYYECRKCGKEFILCSA